MPTASTAVGLLLSALAGAQGTGSAELHEYVVDRTASALYVVTHRSGLLSFFGHEHAIVPEEWRARLCVADPVPEGAHGSITILTRSLVVDSEAARTVARLGRGPGDADRGAIQGKLLDEDRLAAERHPEIHLEAVATGAEVGGTLPARGTITVRGVTRPLELPIRVERSGSRLHLAGSIALRQTDFGIEPESIARVVRVSDHVDLHFGLVAGASGAPCPPPASTGGGSDPGDVPYPP